MQVSSRITGGMRFIFGWGRPGRPYPIYDGTVTKAPGSSVTDPFTRLYMEPATAFPRDAPLPEFQQRYCVDSENFDWSDRVASGPAAVRDSRENEARCYDKREIRIADVSGLVLTTGNLHDTPSMAIPREDLSLAGLGSSFTVYGNVSLGRPASYASDPFNLAPSALPPSRTHKQTIAKLYSRVDGDVGLTFLSASAESPAFEFDESVWHIDDYGRQRVNWRTDGETKRRYSDPGPAPFGQAAPTDEQTRHALHGRLGDGNSNLWGTDMVKLSNPQGGGVDTALRAMYRGGAPMLAVTVRDVPSIADIPNALGQHFGYRSGLPVLQQRSINRPSQKDSYASVTGAAVPGQKGIALEGSHPINASWCHTEISALPLFDPVSAAKRPTLLAMFNSWLVGEGLVLPSLLAGAPFAAPAFSGGLEGLEGLRVDAAACAAFRADTAERVAGRRLLTDLGSGEWMMVRNRSDTPGAFGDACAALAYTSSTFRAVFHTADEARCERLDAIGFDLFAEVADVEECLAFCLERGDVCGGFDILTTVAHRQAGVAGECRISRGACEPESMAGALLTGSTQTAYTVAAFEQAHRPITRNCRADEDFSRPYFDPLRAAYNVPTSSGAAPLEGQIWDSELCYACCILQTTAEENAALGSDLDPVTFFDHHAPDSGYVGIDLGEGREAVVTSVRFVPRPGYPERMIGGRFQGSNARDDGYADLVTVLDRPADREYTLLYVPEEKQAAYRYLRYVGPPGAFSDVGEVEFHRGSYQSELSVMQQGNVSYFVDVDALTQPEAVHTAMLVKCAAYGFVPSMLDNEVQEILIPEAQGQMLTTGNLEDIRMEASSFGSIGVLGDATILGDVAIGAPGGSSTLQVNSRLDGASALTFAGPLAGVGAVTSLTMASMTADETAFLPDGSGDGGRRRASPDHAVALRCGVRRAHLSLGHTARRRSLARRGAHGARGARGRWRLRPACLRARRGDVHDVARGARRVGGERGDAPRRVRHRAHDGQHAQGDGERHSRRRAHPGRGHLRVWRRRHRRARWGRRRRRLWRRDERQHRRLRVAVVRRQRQGRRADPRALGGRPRGGPRHHAAGHDRHRDHDGDISTAVGLAALHGPPPHKRQRARARRLGAHRARDGGLARRRERARRWVRPTALRRRAAVRGGRRRARTDDGHYDAGDVSRQHHHVPGRVGHRDHVREPPGAHRHARRLLTRGGAPLRFRGTGGARRGGRRVGRRAARVVRLR